MGKEKEKKTLYQVASILHEEFMEDAILLEWENMSELYRERMCDKAADILEKIEKFSVLILHYDDCFDTAEEAIMTKEVGGNQWTKTTESLLSISKRLYHASIFPATHPRLFTVDVQSMQLELIPIIRELENMKEKQKKRGAE